MFGSHDVCRLTLRPPPILLCSTNLSPYLTSIFCLFSLYYHARIFPSIFYCTPVIFSCSSLLLTKPLISSPHRFSSPLLFSFLFFLISYLPSLPSLLFLISYLHFLLFSFLYLISPFFYPFFYPFSPRASSHSRHMMKKHRGRRESRRQTFELIQSDLELFTEMLSGTV